MGWPGTDAAAEPVPRETAAGRPGSVATSDGSVLDEPPLTAAQFLAQSVEDAAAISPLPLARAAQESVTYRPRHQESRTGRCRVMVVANQKGGVGKTTTAVNLAAALAQSGQRILLIDLDPQGNASTALSIEHGDGTAGTYDVLTGAASLESVRVECPDVPGLFVVPATIDLAGAEIELVSLAERESRLRQALREHLGAEASGKHYDFVLVDCPPSLGLLTVNALAAGDELLVPIQCEYYALEGLSQLLRTIESVREHVNPRLKLGAILLTMFDARTRLAAGVADEVRQHFGALVLRAAVPRSVRISEAPSYGQTVLTYDPDSIGARAYRAAAAELVQQEEPQ